MSLSIIVLVHSEKGRRQAVDKILKLEGENLAEFSTYRITSKDMQRRYRIINAVHEEYLDGLRADVVIGTMKDETILKNMVVSSKLPEEKRIKRKWEELNV